MSNLFKYTKRVLTSVLAAAVVLTAIPSTAFGAEIDEDLAIEVQEAEVAEAGEEVVVENEDAVTTDGASGDEEIVVEEENIKPDRSADDLLYGVVSASGAHDHIGLFTVKGDVATTADSQIKASITAGASGDTDRTAFDSTLGVELYVVPKVGYTFKDQDAAKAVITVEGAWQANTADTTGTPIGESDYSIAKTSKGYVTSTTTGYDFTEAYVLTINGNTDFLNDYKNAFYHDRTATATAAGIKTDLTVKLAEGTGNLVASKIKVTVTGNTSPVATPKLDYSMGYANPISLAGAVADFSTKVVTPVLVKAGQDDDKTWVAENTSLADDTSTNAEYKWDSANAKLYFNSKAVQDAYAAQIDGWSLTIQITDDPTPVTPTKATIVSDSPLVKFVGLAGDADGSIEKVENNYKTEITSTGVERKVGKAVPFKTTVGASSGRAVTAVKYAIGDGAAQVVEPVDVSEGTYGTSGAPKLIKDGSSGGTFSAADDGYGAIPKIDSADAGKTITLTATTTEKVTVFPDANSADSNKSLILFKDGDSLSNDVVTASSTVTTAGFTSSVDSGKDYKFSAVGIPGYEVGTVTVKKYNADGTSGAAIPKATLDTYADDFGVYTIPDVNGKLEITVTAVKLGADQADLKTAGAYSGAEFKEIKSGAQFTNSQAVKFATGTSASVSFRVKPMDDKMIKSMSYTVYGSDEVHTLTPTSSTIDGTAYYTISGNIVGDVTVTAEWADAARVTKFANPDVTVTYKGQEIKDGKYALVDRSADFSLTVASSATISGVYTKSDSKSSPTITSTANAGTKIGSAAGTYNISKSQITTSAVATTNNLYVTVVTTKNAAASSYTARFDTDRTAKTTSGHEESITSLPLKAGGDVATSATDKESKVKVTAILKDSEGGKINVTTTTGANTWTLGKTAATDAIATVAVAASDYTEFNVTSTQVTGSDTLTYTYKTGFPNETAYTATLPVTSTAMNTIYNRLELVPTVTAGGSAIGAYADTSKLGAALTEVKTIRKYVSSKADDYAEYTVKAFTSTSDTTGTDIAAANIGANLDITSIKYTVAPGYSSTLKPDLKPYLLTGDTTYKAKIATAREAQNLQVTATLTFADGSTKSVSDTLNVIDNSYGYVAVPVTRIGSNTEVIKGQTLDLEATTASLKNASVSYRVFKLLDNNNSAWYASEEAITAAKTARNIEDATATFAAPTVKNNTNNVYASISGTSTLSIQALKKTATGIVISPNATVGNMPVGAPYDVTVNVYNELPRNTVTVVTKDAAEETLGSAYNLSKAYPKMTSGIATMSPISWTPKTKGATPEVYTGFVLPSVPEGTEITLPAESAFDATTINGKKSLYGWKVTVGGNTYYYKADGTAKITINAATTIEALWAYDYSSTAVAADGYVTLYRADGEATPESISTAGTSALTVGQTKSVQLKVGYYKLDASKGPNASGNPQYETTATYTNNNLTFTAASEDFDNIIETPVNGLITGKAVGSVATNVKWVDGTNEFSTYQTDSGLKAATDGIMGKELTVTTNAAKTYTVAFDPITNLEAGETRSGITMSVKLGDTSKGKSGFKSVSFKSSDETVVKVEAADNLESFTATGLKAGNATISFDAIDVNGNHATLTNVAVTVVPSTIEIGLSLALSPAIEGIDRGGDIAATATEIPVMMIKDNVLTLSLKKGGSPVVTTDSDWKYTIKNKGTESPALAAATDQSTSSNKITIAPNALGLSTLEIYYVNGSNKYTRSVDLRSFYAMEVHGATISTEAKYQVNKGSTAIETGKGAFEFIDYENNAADGTAAKYTKSLAGYSGKPLGDTAKSEEFIGWEITSAGGDAAKSPVPATIYGIPAGGSTKELTASDLATLDISTEDGIIDVFARFGDIAPTVVIGGLDSGDIIELDDSKLTTAATAEGVGSDHRTITLSVTPYASNMQYSVEGTDTGKFDLNEAGAFVASPHTNGGYDDGSEWDGSKKNITKDPNALTNKSRVDKFAIAKVYDATGSGAATSVKNVGISKLTITDGNGTKVKDVPVYLNGEYRTGTGTVADPYVYHYMYRGEVLANGIKTVNGKEHVYNDSALVVSGPANYTDETGAAHKILVIGKEWFKTAGRKSYDDNTYYIDENGFLLTSQLYTDGNKQYYLNADGLQVTYAMATEDRGTDSEGKKYGKYTDPKTKVKYVIYEDGTAKPDHKDHKWGFDGFTWSTDGKDATATFTCSVGGESVDAEVTVTNETKTKGDVTITRYTARVTKDPDGKNVNEVDYSYLKADGTKATKADWNKIAGGDDATESEPEQSDVASYQSFNLFYSDVEIPVPGLQDALSNEGAKMSGKWTSFFTVADGSDTVTVSSSADAKKAANAGNSLVVVDYTGGQFAYQLPVFYQKAALKLTSTSGTVKKDVETTLKTTVTEKKSTGLYEAMDLDDDDIKSYTGSVVKYATGSETGEIEITAKAKTSGKFTIQKENWREALTVSYAVKESKNDVIEGPKEVIFNTTSDTKEYEFTITKNGQALDSENTVTVELPKKWSDSGVTGLENGTLDDGDIKLALTGSSPKKGTYNVVFKSGSGKFTVKVKVDNTAKANAIKLKVQTKMNLTTGQKMVVVPTLKNIGGSIDNVEIRLTGSPFTATYLKEKNQIIVSANGLVPVTAGKNSTTFTVTVDGEEIEVPLNNFSVEAKKPTVKLATVTLPKTKVQSSDGADGSTNVLSTYKQLGKVFGVDPVKVVFMNGKNAATESTEHAGWYVVDSKTGLLAQYDATEGKILVHAQNSDGKGGTVKAEFYFNGQAKPITKSFTVKTK